ncbi:MAG: hypothetical protein ACI9T7_000132 [Oleiphilaceae bacterium]|jgi:hypothetical protein
MNALKQVSDPSIWRVFCFPNLNLKIESHHFAKTLVNYPLVAIIPPCANICSLFNALGKNMTNTETQIDRILLAAQQLNKKPLQASEIKILHRAFGNGNYAHINNASRHILH